MDAKVEIVNKYINKFYDPKFSAYDFMCLYCSINALQENYNFNKNNLLNFIKLCKDNDYYNDLLEEINFKNNGVSIYSDDINEAISKLKLGGIIYTISPEKDDSIYIQENMPIIDVIRKEMNYFEEMFMFIKNYHENIKNKGIDDSDISQEENNAKTLKKDNK